MNWIRGLTLVFVAVFFVDSDRAASVDIRLSTILPSGTPQHKLLLELNERWRKDSAGGVKLTVYADGRLGDEADMVGKIRSRQIHAGLFSAVGLSEIDSGVTGLQVMPMMFRSWEEVDYVRDKMCPMLESRLRAKGYVVLFWADAGWVRFFSKMPAVTPDDFRKTKLFAWEGNDSQIELMRSIGFQPVPSAATDVVLGLSTNRFNAVPLPPLVALAIQMQKYAPHMLELNWAPIVGAAIIRADVWEKIPPADRASLQTAADIMGAKFREVGRVDNDYAITAMRKSGLLAHPLTVEDEKEWQTLAAELRPKVRGRLVPTDIFDAVVNHLRDFRGETTITDERGPERGKVDLPHFKPPTSTEALQLALVLAALVLIPIAEFLLRTYLTRAAKKPDRDID